MDGLSDETARRIQVPVVFTEDAPPGGCEATVGGIRVDGGGILRRPCNDAGCRVCDPLRDALFTAGEQALRGRVRREIKRLHAKQRRLLAW